MAKDLTAATVRTAKARPAKGDPTGPVVRTEYPDGQVRGLHLVVYPTGRRSWVLRFRFNDRTKKLTIGPVIDERLAPVDLIPEGEARTLAEARIAASAARTLIAQGIDPTAKAEQEAARAITVREAANRFLVEKRTKRNEPLRPNTLANYRTCFDGFICKAIGTSPIQDVTLAQLHGIIRSCADRPSMANAVHRTISAFFGWCASPRVGIIGSNPFSGIKLESSDSKLTRVLSLSEIGKLWTATKDGPFPFATIVRMLLLTGQRKEEVSQLTAREIDRSRSLWTMAGARTKNREAHTVHLTAATLEELDKAGRGDGFVFRGRSGDTAYAGHKRAHDILEAKLAFDKPWTLHDLRRTVKTRLAELGVPSDVRDAVLNHKSGGSRMDAHYNQHDYCEEKRDALIMWSRFVTDVASDEQVRLAYERLKTRKRFRDAINARPAQWRRYVSLLRRYQRFCEHVTTSHVTE
ncbi:site-specific integrase [Novosphingobium sp. HII-3]|uniref:tyrosine-type recombinase/integrase n=1 Tax=Novosphingobium sp. HII-3 TaxID=2075565 RepID=UPI000CDA5749|nr:site-specific integrase [Novosphingobium sp. HII-3]